MKPAISIPRQLFTLSWPVLVAQAAVMANTLVDTLMAGQISPIDLAAVGVGASIYATVFVSAMGVMLALPPIVAHHFGAQRYAEIGADVRQSAWLAIFLSIAAMLALQFPEPMLSFSRLEPALELKVRAYLDGVSWSIPAMLFFRVFYGFAMGIGRPRPIMVLNVAGLGLKLFFNYLLMFGHFGFPALGSAGAGWSSAAVMSVLAIGAWVWCFREQSFAEYQLFDRFDWPQPHALKELLRLGVPTGLMFLIDVTAFTFMALFIARLGAATSAAHQIVSSVVIFLYTVPLAFGNATGVLVGQALGAEDPARARRVGLLGLQIGSGISLLFGTLVALNAYSIAGWYSTDEQVRHIAATLLVIVAIFHPADALQGVMAQILRGYKRATVPMLIYALALWGVGLGGGYMFGLTNFFGAPLGAVGFWLAASAGLGLAGVSVTLYFRHIASHAVAVQPMLVGKGIGR
ncbi:MAG: MATE family efflux transporter [Rhodocyclaceae bacterium]|nr:MATE family efflux transporter [Rhodocyclaceae bacterium]